MNQPHEIKPNVRLKKSSVNDFVFYEGNVMYILDIDDFILDIQHKDEFGQMIQDTQNENINITTEIYM